MNINQTVQTQTDALNRHDLDGFMSVYSPDAVAHDPMYTEPLRGHEAIARDMSEFFRAFPDLHSSGGQMITEGDTYALEFTMSGTHEGPLPGPEGTIQATHRRIEFPIAIFGRADGQGRIIEERRYYDVAGILNQMGALHAAGA